MPRIMICYESITRSRAIGINDGGALRQTAFVIRTIANARLIFAYVVIENWSVFQKGREEREGRERDRQTDRHTYERTTRFLARARWLIDTAWLEHTSRYSARQRPLLR